MTKRAMNTKLYFKILVCIPASDVTVLLHTAVPTFTEVIAEMQQE